jgi:hypothetical protein
LLGAAAEALEAKQGVADSASVLTPATAWNELEDIEHFMTSSIEYARIISQILVVDRGLCVAY